MRKFVYTAAALAALGCSKQADESAKSAEAPAATPAAEPAAQSELEADTPAAPPPPVGASPAPAGDDEAPTSAKPKKKARDKTDLLERELTSVAEAEAALNKANSELTKLLGGAKAQPLASGDKRCDQACLAFASLKRAADAICRLAGDTDARCTRAKRIVDDNESKVKACSCEE